MKKILLLSFMLLLTLSFSALAQERTVTGTVTSATDGSELPGVNVILKGTNTGAITDIEGKYSVTVPSNGGVLQFSFIGLKSEEIEIGARSVIDIAMNEDVETLEEVIVTGYQNQLKRDLTGAVTSVKGDEIANIPLQSFDRAIQGRVAGVQIASQSGAPGAGVNIRIRGIGSVNASNDPLIIIDGVQVASNGGTTQGSSNPLNSINPNDIESIDVLKDAAASAIYGAQAANGVVIVTTKNGSKTGKPQINISAQEGVTQPFNLYEVLDGQQYATIRAEAERNVGQDPARTNGAFDLYGNPENPESIDNFDWKDAIFRDARFRVYDISMSGSTDRTNYFFGGSYNDQEGQILNSSFQRVTGRLNLTTRVTDKLTVGAKLSLAHLDQFGAIESGNFVNSPFIGAFSAIPTSVGIDPETGEYNPYPTNGINHLFGYNIIQGVEEEVRTGRTFQTVSSANASYQILPSLSISGLVGVDFSMNRDDNQRPASIPVFAGNGGSIFINNRRSLNVNTNVNLNFNKTFNDVHVLKAIAGYEYKFEEREGNNLRATGFADPFFRLPGDGLADNVGGFFQEYKRLGIFGKVDYTFSDKYLASVTIRRDGHSRFGSENRFGTFGAVSFGWRISEEGFLSGVSWIDDLKLKASYGILGNAEIGNYRTNTIYGGSSGQYDGNSTLTISLLGNNTITWEEEESFNIGIDFAIFNNRLYGSVDAYRTNNNDLLFNVPFLQTGGVVPANITDNIGSLRNQGIDIDLGAVILDQGGFRWTSNFNISFLENEVTSLVDSDTIFSTTAPNFPSLIVGEPVNFFYLVDFAGVNPATGQALSRNADGELIYNPQFADAGVRGSAIPTQFGGISNTFSYKGLTLDVFFQYQLGNKAFNGDLYNILDPGGNDNRRVDILDRWQQPGDLTNYPRLTPTGIIKGIDQDFDNFGSTRYLSDASYVRLKTLTLSYDIGKKVLDKIGMRSARVFVQGVNLATFTNFDGIDP
ncbi:MAG: TonB-dependent receptor, partial [Cyclobacteriaceae bacterium]